MGGWRVGGLEHCGCVVVWIVSIKASHFWGDLLRSPPKITSRQRRETKKSCFGMSAFFCLISAGFSESALCLYLFLYLSVHSKPASVVLLPSSLGGLLSEEKARELGEFVRVESR